MGRRVAAKKLLAPAPVSANHHAMSSTPLPRQLLAVLTGLVALLALGACDRRGNIEVHQPPGFAKDNKLDPHDLALRMRVFHVQQIWAGAGYEADGNDYRAKVTIWSYSQGEPALAELYFHDSEKFDPSGRHTDSVPQTDQMGPLHIHFPITAFGPIIGLMRSANEPVYLFYFRSRWCLGTSLAEAIGSE